MTRADEIIEKQMSLAKTQCQEDYYPALCGRLKAEIQILCNEIDELKRKIEALTSIKGERG